jgi:hypothetical protein
MTATDPIPRGQVVRAIAHRDLLEFVRDRRTLFVTLLMPMAMYPVLALASTLGLRTALSPSPAQTRSSSRRGSSRSPRRWPTSRPPTGRLA